jgi:hypothetical protein
MQRRPLYFQIPAFIVPVSHLVRVSRIQRLSRRTKTLSISKRQVPRQSLLRPDHLSVLTILSSHARFNPKGWLFVHLLRSHASSSVASSIDAQDTYVCVQNRCFKANITSRGASYVYAPQVKGPTLCQKHLRC